MTSQPDSSARLLLFDLSIYGHHPGYIQYFLKYWQQLGASGTVFVLVCNEFLREHRDVVEYGQSLNADQIQFIAISDREEASLRPRSNGINRNLRNFQEWFLLCRYAKRLQVDHALVMYYDTYQYPLALRLNPVCSVSGIYFRPTFHYATFAQHHSQNQNTRWERFILDRVLANPKLHALFSLDQFVVQYYAKEVKKLSHKLIHLADPVEIQTYTEPDLRKIKTLLNIDPHRKLFLLFGALTERKGISKLLQSLWLLNPEDYQNIALAIVGEASPDQREKIETQIVSLCHKFPIQIYRNYQFVPEADVQAYFEVSDLILAPYQNHVGMSGILILAAAKQKPVISSNYGLMGEIIQRYQLGLAVDSTDPQSIAQGIQRYLNNQSQVLWNQETMQQFALQNTAEKFASTLLQVLPRN
ncbi:MAG: glycosyltransferase family 4 protein [Prochlorotrichaceae cyanobacterium]|jgi:glycosyltransferase involved in cell wall biosynthesis